MRPTSVAASAATALLLSILSASPALGASAGDAGLPNVDRRAVDRALVPAAQTAARRRLDGELGPQGAVRTDRASGGVSFVGRTDGLLTGPSAEPPEQIVLDYVRSHGGAFGLDRADVDRLELVARNTSPDGITHLRYNQTIAGIRAFDSGITAGVTSAGRLINVTGAPVPGATLDDTSPSLPAAAGLGEAREDTRSARLPARATSASAGPSRATTFADGDRATLRWSATADGPRLAWDVLTTADDGHLYAVLVDADDGSLLRRQDLTSHLGQVRRFAADPDRTPAVEETMPSAYFDDHANGTRLWGQYAHTYVDPSDADSSADPAVANAETGGGREQIPASNGAGGSPDWLYTRSTAFPGASPCPTSGCSWNHASPATNVTNRFEAATNAHALVSRFHDHLAAAPIGFTPASGNFQRSNPAGEGLGNDWVRVETNDGITKPGGPTLNNANMNTPPDGQPPRMQMFLFSDRNANGSDVADIVYHEYGHGLSNRLVVNASGNSTLSAQQGRMMGEAWSDFYANDLLVGEGTVSDTPAPGELVAGEHAVGAGGVRAKPADCPVADAGIPGCNGNQTATTVLGGYTYGDIKRTNLTTPHNGGEVWSETLWDLRTALMTKLGAAAGRNATLALVTGGMRLSVANPSMLDMRDAILQQAVAMRSAPGAADDLYADVWEVFRNRGMGADATTAGADSTSPADGFQAPAGLRPGGRPVVTDPYPGGDADGTVEPGEELRIGVPVTGIGVADLGGVQGTLSAPGLTVLSPTATWPVLGRGRTASNTAPLVARTPAGQCTAKSALSVSITSSEGGLTVPVTVDPRPGSGTSVALEDGSGPSDTPVAQTTEATFVARGSGTITDVDLRIDELRHTWLGDLQIALVSPAGTVVKITDNWGNEAFGGDDVRDAVFDDAAPALPTPGNDDPGPITGRIKPIGALSTLNGQAAAGTWRLRITDLYPGDVGTLEHWGLTSDQVGCGRAEIPVAATAPADAVAPSTATLNGAVTPNGRTTGLRFAYGTTAAYGQTTGTQDVGAGDAAAGRSAAVTDLAPGTLYHYRVEAVREGGVVAVTGADATVRTAPTPVDPGPGGGAGPTDPGAGGGSGGGAVTTPPPGPRPAPPADTSAPKLTGVKASLKQVGRTARRRATFRFGLSEAGRVTAAVVRTAPGIRKGSRCVAVPRKRPAKARSCVREVQAVATTVTVPQAGTGRTLTLPAKGLPKGSYVARLTAVDATGNRSASVKVAFRVR